MRIITEPRELIGRYVALKTGDPNDWGRSAMFGLVNDDDVLVAGIVFNGYRHPGINMSIAADRMTPGFIAAAMRYAFIQCGCERVTGVVLKKNHASRRFSLHLGAKLEGCLRKASTRGDLLVYGLLREDAQKWLTERYRTKLEHCYG